MPHAGLTAAANARACPRLWLVPNGGSAQWAAAAGCSAGTHACPWCHAPPRWLASADQLGWLGKGRRPANSALSRCCHTRGVHPRGLCVRDTSVGPACQSSLSDLAQWRRARTTRITTRPKRLTSEQAAWRGNACAHWLVLGIECSVGLDGGEAASIRSRHHAQPRTAIALPARVQERHQKAGTPALCQP